MANISTADYSFVLLGFKRKMRPVIDFALNISRIIPNEMDFVSHKVLKLSAQNKCPNFNNGDLGRNLGIPFLLLKPLKVNDLCNLIYRPLTESH